MPTIRLRVTYGRILDSGGNKVGLWFLSIPSRYSGDSLFGGLITHLPACKLNLAGLFVHQQLRRSATGLNNSEFKYFLLGFHCLSPFFIHTPLFSSIIRANQLPSLTITVTLSRAQWNL